eukprot:ANDGO_07956.mRNA.1 hypothetical protein
MEMSCSSFDGSDFFCDVAEFVGPADMNAGTATGRTVASAPSNRVALCVLDTADGYESWSALDIPAHKRLSMEIDLLYAHGQYAIVAQKCEARIHSFERPYPSHLRSTLQSLAAVCIRNLGEPSKGIAVLSSLTRDLDRGKVTDSVAELLVTALCASEQYESALQVLFDCGLPHCALLAKCLKGLDADSLFPGLHDAVASRKLDRVAEKLEVAAPHSEPCWCAPLRSLLKIRPS